MIKAIKIKDNRITVVYTTFNFQVYQEYNVTSTIDYKGSRKKYIILTGDKKINDIKELTSGYIFNQDTTKDLSIQSINQIIKYFMKRGYKYVRKAS